MNATYSRATAQALAEATGVVTAADDVVHLVRHHMFQADADATDAAIRRFSRRIGAAQLDALLLWLNVVEEDSTVSDDALSRAHVLVQCITLGRKGSQSHKDCVLAHGKPWATG